MKTCWKCRRQGSQFYSTHHINRNQEDNRLINLINLCSKCHDLVQAICDKCSNQPICHIKRFQTCWRFEDAIPPIYFCPSRDMGMIPQNDTLSNNINGLVKNGKNMKTSMISINNEIANTLSLKCLICNRLERKIERVNPENEFICSKCVLWLVNHPRRQFETKKESLIMCVARYKT